MSVLPRKNSKTLSSLNFLQSGLRKFTKSDFSGLAPIRRALRELVWAANANKRRQTLTNASKRRGQNASKSKQTRANADKHKQRLTPPLFRNGPNTVSESTVSNTELSEFFGPHRVPGRELSEFLSAYHLCAKANSPSSS